VLGAQPVRPLDLAAFYAAIANEGLRPVPHSVDSIDRDGQTIYRYQQTASGTISSVDRAAFYQLKTMMQGVLARGTANAISGLAPYVAGKTGTSDEENDAWFVGFTNDVTVAVWLWLRQCHRQAPHPRGGRDRRRRRCPDLRADHSGGMGECRPESGACSAVAGG
jgi:membrane peptidoglycan carboxypeptidase